MKNSIFPFRGAFLFDRTRLRGTAKKRGFSLIEVVLALGVVSFSMLTIIGLLGVGLSTVHDAENQEAISNITTQIRGQLQLSTFNAQGIKLTQSTYYYTADAIETTAASSTAYYKVSLTANSVSPTGTVSAADATFASINAQSVSVIVQYPMTALAANQSQSSFPLFVANQTGN